MTGAHRYVARTTKREDGGVFIGLSKQSTHEQARRIFVGQIIRLTYGLDGRVLRTDPSIAVWISYGQHPCCPQLTHTLGSRVYEVHRFDNRMCRYGKWNRKKGRNLLEGFVWPIDTGRLMGDAVS